jgi:hypothetical protein
MHVAKNYAVKCMLFKILTKHIEGQNTFFKVVSMAITANKRQIY